MPSVLDLIAPAIAAGFKGKLSQGTLRRDRGGAVNALGDAAAPATVELFPFEGIRDNFNASYAASAGIPLTDVRVMIIAGLIQTAPQKDDYIFIRPVTGGTADWLQVRAILSIDPAVATYTLQCFKIPTPLSSDGLVINSTSMVVVD